MRPLSNVQVLRGLAASIVVLFHVWEELGQRKVPNSWPNMTAGAFGVDVFFVISGFIMVYATSPNFGSASSAGSFLFRRLARIVPLYWVVTALYVLFTVRTHQDPGFTKPYLAASFLFVPYPQPGDGDYFPAYPLGWTLQYEMFFYFCLSGALALRRTLAVAVLSAGLVALVVAGSLGPLPWPLDAWSSSQILEFVFGAILAEAFLRGLRLPTSVCSVLALTGIAAAVAVSPSIDDWLVWRGVVWGLPATAIMAAAVFHRPTAGGMVRRAFEQFGDASYSLYLVHYLLFVIIARIFEHLGIRPDHMRAPAYAAFLAAAALVSAFLTYRCFERPVTRWLQRRMPSIPLWLKPCRSSNA